MHSQTQARIAHNPETGKALASIARSMLGVPYRWGGASRSGLDCSGLVQYAHLKLGIDVPRNSQDQLVQASPVHPAQLHPGDLVFFKISWRNKPSHVGMYTGDGRFIHAPSSGKPVSYASLQNPFWKDRLVAAGRFY
jgi:cell wall-associated NlpC family hydrolase